MYATSSFAKTLSLSQLSLGVSTIRQGVIANNIANVDTPHYKKKMVTFEAELSRRLEDEKKPLLPFRMTEQRHLPLRVKRPALETTPQVLREFDTNYRNDKNNVDIEKEIGDLVKNSMHYQAITTLVRGHFRRLKTVLVNNA